MQQVQDLKIENNFGKILFKESVNISQINIPLSKWALISNKNVEVLAQELKNKKCEIQIFNFMDYLSKRYLIQSKWLKWVTKSRKSNSIQLQEHFISNPKDSDHDLNNITIYLYIFNQADYANNHLYITIKIITNTKSFKNCY